MLTRMWSFLVVRFHATDQWGSITSVVHGWEGIFLDMWLFRPRRKEADSITGLPLFLFKLLNSWREYVSGVVLAVVVSVAVLIVVAVGRDFGCDIVVIVLGALLF